MARDFKQRTDTLRRKLDVRKTSTFVIIHRTNTHPQEDVEDIRQRVLHLERRG